MKSFFRFFYFFIMCGLVEFLSCAKFEDVPSIPKAAYLRVFNSLTYTYDASSKNLPQPYLIFFLDPVKNSEGDFTNKALFVGDFLDVREPFSTSFPSKAGNIGILRKFEWPGSASVLTAPSINGLDLSAWAQIPSGKHKIVFLSRSQADTSFFDLPILARKSVIVDTTIDFEPGEVYTAQAVLSDEKNAKTGLYVRKEQFTHKQFYDDYNYFSLYNLTPRNSYQPYYRDTVNVFYTVNKSFCTNVNSDGTTKYECFFRPDLFYNQVFFHTLSGAFQSTATFDSLPVIAKENYLYPNGTFQQAKDQPFTTFEIRNLGPSGGTSFNCGNASGSCPSLDIITSNGKALDLFSSINIFELINNKVFTMQINKLAKRPLKQ